MLPRPAASGTRHFAPAVEWGPPVHASGTSPERSLGQGRQTLEAVAAVEGSSAGEVRSSQPADRTAGAPLTRLGARSTTLPRLYAATADPGVGGCPGEPSRSAGLGRSQPGSASGRHSPLRRGGLLSASTRPAAGLGLPSGARTRRPRARARAQSPPRARARAVAPLRPLAALPVGAWGGVGPGWAGRRVT